MGDDERLAMLSAMYQDEAEQLSLKKPFEATGRTQKVRVGVIEYEVPTLAYVQQLENLVRRQAAELADHRRKIERLVASLMKSGSHQTSHARKMADLQRELDKKIGRE